MAKKKFNAKSEFALFNVLYEDGAMTSNRKVPSSTVGTLDGDVPVLEAIQQQDREIEERSGKPRGPIKSITRVG
jgi:hypothetical protein